MTDLEYTPIPDPLPLTVDELQARIMQLEDAITASNSLIDAQGDALNATRNLLTNCGFAIITRDGRTGLQGHGQTFFPPRPNAATSAYLDRLAAPGVERKP